MKRVRSKNPVAFDLALFLMFSLVSFAAFGLTEIWGSSGAMVGLGLLALTCIALVFSR